MDPQAEKPAADTQPTTAPLLRALNKSVQVQEKVERAATDLSAVNAVLKDEIAEGVPLANIEIALTESEDVESKVQEAAAELVDVNDALAQEIGERDQLENRLSNSDRSEERRVGKECRAW